MNTRINSSENVPEVDSISASQLILIALVCEGILLLIYLLASFFLGTLESPRLPYLKEVLFGVLLAILLCFFNASLVRASYRNNWSWITVFVDEIITPLVSKLRVWHALVISLAAGIGEEFFFRGLLQPHIGIVFSSALFALAHFAFEIRRFYKLLILYFFVGVLFGLIYELFDSLWVPIIFHVMYDFLAILYFRYFFHYSVERSKTVSL